MEKELYSTLQQEGILMENRHALWYEKKLRAHQSTLVLTPKRLVLEKNRSMFLHQFGLLGAILPFVIRSLRPSIIFNVLHSEIKAVEVEKFFRNERLLTTFKDERLFKIIVGNKANAQEWKQAIENNIKQPGR
jgi:hypothetical protein